MSSVTLDAVRLSSNYLEEVATKRAKLDARIQDVSMSCLEELVHVLFYYFFYVFYPSYEQFYYERRVEAYESAGKVLPRYEASYFGEAVLFLHRFIASPSTIGSIFPSSSGLIESITRQIDVFAADPTPRRYLEIGAGTGPFTEEIVKKLRSQDHLDVVEYDKDLAKLLVRKFRHYDNVTIHPVSITDFKAEKYDAVVSGLPLNVFQAQFVDLVLKKYVELTKPNGHISYFEFMGLGALKKALLCGEAYEDFSRILEYKQQFVDFFGSETDEIYCNLTPARVLHCVVTEETARDYLDERERSEALQVIVPAT